LVRVFVGSGVFVWVKVKLGV
jgi:hypothetical protein